MEKSPITTDFIVKKIDIQKYRRQEFTAEPVYDQTACDEIVVFQAQAVALAYETRQRVETMNAINGGSICWQPSKK